VLILLIFYSMQIWLNDLTEALGWDYVEIDPFGAGVITLGFIYGAYFTENFRGAILSVPAGQLEAATAYGLSRAQRFRLVLFPQLMRFALPGWATTGWCCSSPPRWCRSSAWPTWSRPRRTPARPPTTCCSSCARRAGLPGHHHPVQPLLKRLERRYNIGIKGLAR
jgi:histidine transport system permease protein